MNQFEFLQKAVIKWADVRGLLDNPNIEKQALKFFEESGELAGGLVKGKNSLIEDSFGDILVTIIILAKQLDKDLIDCLNLAYEDIKDRDGKLINGSFVKAEDL